MQFNPNLRVISDCSQYTGIMIQVPSDEFLTEAIEGIQFPLQAITMPCGFRLAYKTHAEIPRITTPCPCGDSKHFLIRVEIGKEVRS